MLAAPQIDDQVQAGIAHAILADEMLVGGGRRRSGGHLVEGGLEGLLGHNGLSTKGGSWAIPQRNRVRLAERLLRSEEHTSELQSLMRISYAVFCLKKKKTNII